MVRRLNGFDYENFGEKWVRGGRRLAQVGRCTGPVTWPGPMLVEDLRFTIKHSRTPVKITLPGPMTVCDSILDEFYGNEESMAMAVADALNIEAKALASEGASVVQFDEPVFSRYPDKVLELGYRGPGQIGTRGEGSNRSARVLQLPPSRSPPPHSA